MTDHPDMLEDFGWIVLAALVVLTVVSTAAYIWEWVL